MSELVVTPVVISDLQPHPNADRLEIATVGGWRIVTGKGNYSVGDVVVHIPPDSMVPQQWADEWGVTQYLSWKKDAPSGRVRAARLRGEVSFGFLVPNESGAELGADLAEHYGVTKYEPPPPPVGMSAGQMRSEHPLFERYTDIQNLRNFTDKLNYGIPLVVLEKIHGTNSRVGWVKSREGDGLELVCGTHRTQRDPEDCGVYSLPIDKYRSELEHLRDFMQSIMDELDMEMESLIVFGEIFGAGVQDLHYGAKQEKDYRVFDVVVNGKYLPWDSLHSVCERVGLPVVPVLGRGDFSFEELQQFAQGDTTLNDEHIREGVVVRPASEELTWGKGEQDPHPKRMIFKVISDAYLLRKGGTEFH